jgi:hypothetical protein
MDLPRSETHPQKGIREKIRAEPKQKKSKRVEAKKQIRPAVT